MKLCYSLPSALLLLLVLTPLTVSGRVYSLRPGSGVGDVQKILSPKKILSETVTVNGAKGTLEVGYTNKRVAAVMDSLRGILENYQHRKGETSVLIDVPGRDRLVRYYIFSAGDDKKTLIFHLTVPKAGLQDNPARFWPKDLPPPQVGAVDQVMQLHKSKGVYATFTATGDAEKVYYQYSSQLKGGGWKQLSSSGNGAAYMSADGKRMLTFSVVAGQNGAFAAVYLRTITK